MSSGEELESQRKEDSSKPFEDADAWMRDDAISVEDDDEEKDSLLPFGLNQSWPRVANPVRRNTIPRFHPRTLHRQISQESLDVSTSLLRDHVVMLPSVPHEVMPHSVPHEVMVPSVPREVMYPSVPCEAITSVPHEVMLPSVPHEVTLQSMPSEDMPSVPNEGVMRTEDSRHPRFSCPVQEGNDMKEMNQTKKGVVSEQVFLPIQACDSSAPATEFGTKMIYKTLKETKGDDSQRMSSSGKSHQPLAFPRSTQVMAWENEGKGTNNNGESTVEKSCSAFRTPTDSKHKLCTHEDNHVSEMITNMMLCNENSSLLRDDLSSRSSSLVQDQKSSVQDGNQVSEMIVNMMVSDEQEINHEGQKSNVQDGNQVSEMIFNMMISDDQEMNQMGKKSNVQDDNQVSEMIFNMMISDDQEMNQMGKKSNVQDGNQVSEMIFNMMVSDDQDMNQEGKNSSVQDGNEVSEMIVNMMIDDDQGTKQLSINSSPVKLGSNRWQSRIDENSEVSEVMADMMVSIPENDVNYHSPFEPRSVIENQDSHVKEDSKVSGITNVMLSNHDAGQLLQNFSSGETGMAVVRKAAPVQRRKKKPPLLRQISQESIDESTILLLDHVVLMDVHQTQREKEASKSDQCLYLMDIAEDPLVGGHAVSLLEEEEEFLYKGEMGSSDEDDDDEQSNKY